MALKISSSIPGVSKQWTVLSSRITDMDKRFFQSPGRINFSDFSFEYSLIVLTATLDAMQLYFDKLIDDANFISLYSYLIAPARVILDNQSSFNEKDILTFSNLEMINSSWTDMVNSDVFDLDSANRLAQDVVQYMIGMTSVDEFGVIKKY